MLDRLRSGAFGAERPPLWLGLLVAAGAVGLASALIYPLQTIASTVSLSVVYLPGVLLVSASWGLGLGLLTSLLSAAAFNFFHIPPVGQFTIADSRNWVALAAFILVAAVVSTIAELARARAIEAERRRAEADLAAGLARELLAGERTEAALAAAAGQVAATLTIPAAGLELGTVAAPDRQLALPLRGAGGEQIATLLVGERLPAETLERLRNQVAPALAALVAVALRRDAVQAEAVETAALRRSDELKTVLLRAVSHDLRTPLTAIVTAGHALGAGSLTGEERTELSAAVVEEGQRLSALIDKLLDLSRLQAGRAEPREDWISLEEVLISARDALRAPADDIRLSIEPQLPPLRADAAQLERVFANLLENARRYSGGLEVSVHARHLGRRLVVRVVDRGPGIDAAERQRIFEPFYRGPQAAGRPWSGSGLGLAIAKGFVEANRGTLTVESLPGQGTAFVVSLPLPEPAAEASVPPAEVGV